MLIRTLAAFILITTAVFPAAAAEGVAVVELFTSEGCSSCPPADRLLSTLVEEARANGKPIYPMAYHVDYWNRLGWPDRFANAAFSGLQSLYAQKLGERRVFTPQVVVNGRSSHIGSDGPSIREAISKALSRPAVVTLNLQVHRANDRNALTVVVSAKGVRSPTIVRVAAVEGGLTTAVGAGENNGRTLRHDNVVRSVDSIDVRSEAVSATLELPADALPRNITVIAVAQEKQTLEIVGATSVAAPVADKRRE